MMKSSGSGREGEKGWWSWRARKGKLDGARQALVWKDGEWTMKSCGSG